MRYIFLISIILFVTGISVCGQNPTVKTPYGTEVDVYEQPEGTDGDRYFIDSVRAIYYPSAVFIPTYPSIPDYPDLSSTQTFNCHGYAWHMSKDDPLGEDLSDPYVMGPTDAETYFTDPSYKECVKADAQIWWINDGSHSALATSTVDYLKSKWDNGPLAYHHKNHSPYTLNSVKYYKRCFYRLTGLFDVDYDEDHCKVELLDASVYNNVDLTIEYEDWVRINNDFSTGTGATLDIHPVPN